MPPMLPSFAVFEKSLLDTLMAAWGPTTLAALAVDAGTAVLIISANAASSRMPVPTVLVLILDERAP
jgi:hypothetical protein